MVVSGTFGVLYDLVGASAEDMRLSPILKRFRTAPPLDFGRDICQTDDQADGVWRQLRVGVVQVLLKYSDGFSSYEDSLDPRLQHARRRSPPFRQGIKTKQFPLRLTKIEENTIHNQPDIIVEFYERQLGLSGESELADVAIPCYNDQLTNTLLRSAQVLRQNDVNALLRLENFQLAPGLFHLAMNFNWAINSTHIGTPTQLGSGSYIFHHVLKRSRLSNERPDYYTLQQALFETSDAIVLSGWTLQSRKCGFPTLAAFAASKPAPEELLRIADLVLETCVLPMEEPHTLKLSKGRKSRKEEDVSSTTKEELMPAPARGDASAPIASVKKRKKAAQQIKKEQSIEQIDERTPAELTAHIRAMSNPYSDIAHRNFRLFARDILLSKELVSATSAGDFGRIEDLLGVLAMIFRGAGSNKYCYENLHLIHNLKNVWTSKFADIMRDNIFVNMSGNAQRSMAVDLNIEHLIGCLKDLLLSKGMHSGWQLAETISSIIDLLLKIKRELPLEMRTAYQSTSHSVPASVHESVWKIVKDIEHTQILVFTPNRPGNETINAVPDLLSLGGQRLRSTTLDTFNKKLKARQQGRDEGELDVDQVDEEARADGEVVLEEAAFTYTSDVVTHDIEIVEA